MRSKPIKQAQQALEKVEQNKVKLQTSAFETELCEMREAFKEIASSPESARRFLIRTGMYTRDGKLKPQFR
jgi:hypothetical protein